MYGGAVDVANAGLQILRQVPRPGAVPAVYRRREAIFAFIGDGQRFGFVLNANNRFHRTERLLMPDAHFPGDAIKQGGAHLRRIG